MINLYKDQAEIIHSLRKSMTAFKAILLQSPTGSGKTAMAIWMISEAVKKGKSVGFVVPRRELLKQTSQSFEQYGIHHSFIAAGKPFNPFASAYIGMVDTMARRINDLPKLDIVFIDETHFGQGSLDKVISHYKALGAWVIGLSATPWKASGQGLGCWYDDIVMGKSIRWLIDNERLSDYKFYASKNKPDLSSIKVTGGDYAKGELASYMEEKRVIIGDCVNDYRNRAIGKLHVVRCASIKHSQITAQAFKDNSISAQHVDGTTPDDEMRRIIRAYARREITVLTFCDLLGFGFDLSQASGMDVCIESGSDLKPSKSLAGQMQFWGRMLRYKPYPAIIIDHASNYEEHGFPCSDRDWTLKDRKQGKRESNDGEHVPVKQCDSCFFVHPPAPKCPECGYEYPIQSRDIEQVDGKLEEIDPRAAVIERKKEQGQAQTLGELIALGKRRGYQNPYAWASKVLNARKKAQASKSQDLFL